MITNIVALKIYATALTVFVYWVIYERHQSARRRNKGMSDFNDKLAELRLRLDNLKPEDETLAERIAELTAQRALFIGRIDEVHRAVNLFEGLVEEAAPSVPPRG